MKNKSLIVMMITIILSSLALVGCGGSEAPETGAVVEAVVPANEDSTEESVSDPSADAPAITGTTVTSLKEIEGTWIAAAYPGNFVLTIFPDGSLSVATSLEDLREGSTDTWQLTMEEGEITATDFALCLGDVGSYVATLREDGTMRFTSIIDPCDARLRKMDRSLPGRLNEYILIYYPVE